MAPPKTKKQASISRFFSPRAKADSKDTGPSLPGHLSPLLHSLAKRAGPEHPPSPKARKSLPTASDATTNGHSATTSDAGVSVNATIPTNSIASSNESGEEVAALQNSTPSGVKNRAKQPPAPKGPKGPKALKSAKLTPLEQQYTQLKRQNADKVLAIQVGYKYKFFGQDAVVASLLLNIMLIPGNIHLDERTHDRFAYCLIPDVRLHVHLQRLLNHGMKVGVVKQTESAAIKSVESSKSGLFQRHITAVYTKATYMGDENADEKSFVDENGDDFIVCIYEDGPDNETSIVGVQPTTGEVVYDVFARSRDALDTRLAHMSPSEVILVRDTDSDAEDGSAKKNTGNHGNVGLEALIKLQFPNASVHTVPIQSTEEVQQTLERIFSLAQSSHVCEYFLLNFKPSVVVCISELASYLEEFKLSNIFTVTSNITAFSDSRTAMVLPAGTLRALDIFEVHDDPGARKGTLLWLLENTLTRSGATMLRKWVSRPLLRREDIMKRLNAVETLIKGDFVHILDAFRGSLVKLGRSGVKIDRTLTKIHYSATQENDRVSRREIFLMLRSITDILQVFRDFGPAATAEFRAKFPRDLLISEILEQMLQLSAHKIIDGLLAQIDPAMALSQLDVSELKRRFFNLESDAKFACVLLEKKAIQQVEKDLDAELVDIRKLLKRPQLQYVSVLKDTHLIEVRNGKQTDTLPADWLKISATKSVSRYRPARVSALHKQLQYHTEKLMQECDRCFKAYLQEIDMHHEYIRQVVRCLSKFDCLLSLAAAGKSEIGHVKPEIVDLQAIKIKLGLHPILLHTVPAGYVPNDINMTYDENRVLIITGPNMGGKSSLVKQIALLVIMTQVGCFLPCTEAQMGVFDSIYIRMGARDNILKGQSTFMMEMQECGEILLGYTGKSLVILDEIGRGTGTKDGVALAYAILKYIIEDKQSPMTLFITHYPSLHVLEKEHAAVHNYHMAFLEQRENDSDWPEVIFLYKVIQGVVSNSYGLNVAKLAGIDKTIIDAAHAVSEKMKLELEGHSLQKSIAEFQRGNVFESLSRVLQAAEGPSASV